MFNCSVALSFLFGLGLILAGCTVPSPGLNTSFQAAVPVTGSITYSSP